MAKVFKKLFAGDAVATVCTRVFKKLTTEAHSVLPAEYQRVEYLESTAKEWIDTGIKPTKAADLEFVGSITENTEDSMIAGAPYSIGIRKIAGTVTINKTPPIGVQYIPVDINEVFAIGLFGDKVYFNGVEKYTLERIDAVLTLFLFADHHIISGTGSAGAAVRMHSFKIWESGVLIREYIPCYRKSDNKPGMYDLVTKTFSINAGEGEFICGGNLE